MKVITKRYWNGRKTFYELIQEQICLLIYATLGTHSHIMAAGDSGIPVCPGSCWGGGEAIALKPPKADVPLVDN